MIVLRKRQGENTMKKNSPMMEGMAVALVAASVAYLVASNFNIWYLAIPVFLFVSLYLLGMME